MSAFFMSYEFHASAAGFTGQLSGSRIYSVDYFEQVEKLINDALKILKTGSDATITFEHFDGYGSTALSRIHTACGVPAGKAENVTWKRNSYGYVSETNTEEITITKKEVKRLVLAAIELFREEDNKGAA